VGGWKRDGQKFSRLSSEASAGQMVAGPRLLPAMFFYRRRPGTPRPDARGVGRHGHRLLITYAAGLWFTFRTHHHLLRSVGGRTRRAGVADVAGRRHLAPRASRCGGRRGSRRRRRGGRPPVGLNEVFLGVVVLAMIGNAAENSAAVQFAYRDRMDLAINIVTQASVQIALFVTPVLVLLSFPLGHPLDLLFSTFEILSMALAVAIVAYLVLNGETNWFEGVQLLALYSMIAVAITSCPDRIRLTDV
jgi:Ca2+:H+ antiporter